MVIFVGLIGVAAVAIIVRQKTNTVGVIQSIGAFFTNILGAAVAGSAHAKSSSTN